MAGRMLSRVQGVLHASGLGGPWYGSDSVIDSVRPAGKIAPCCAFDITRVYGSVFRSPSERRFIILPSVVEADRLFKGAAFRCLWRRARHSAAFQAHS